MHRDALLERSLLEQGELDRHVVVVEQRPAEAEDRGMGPEQQLVEQLGAEQLRGQRRAVHTDGAVGLSTEGGELLDRVVSADDPGVVIGAVAGAGDEHLGFGSGIHSCFGAPLARIEAQIAFTELLRRLAQPRLVADPPPYRPSPFLRGPEHLPIEVEVKELRSKGKPTAEMAWR